MDMIRSEPRIDPARALIDHAEEHTIGEIKDNGFWFGLTLYPNSKGSPERAIDAVETFGTERLCINSSADWSVSDPLSILNAPTRCVGVDTRMTQSTRSFSATPADFLVNAPISRPPDHLLHKYSSWRWLGGYPSPRYGSSSQWSRLRFRPTGLSHRTASVASRRPGTDRERDRADALVVAGARLFCAELTSVGFLFTASGSRIRSICRTGAAPNAWRTQTDWPSSCRMAARRHDRVDFHRSDRFQDRIGEDDLPLVRQQLIASLTHLRQLRDRHGREIVLALEPEPGCLLETTEEACRFFEALALPAELSDFLGLSATTASNT